jgi:hypothetical protein
MISKLRSRTIIVLFALAAMSAVSIFVFQDKSSAAGFNGAIYTTTFDGQSVNENTFSTKDAVYLSGGPQNQNTNGLPDGTYYFQVTDPSGATLLSTDLAVCRQLLVAFGKVVAAEGPACQHSTGIPNSANGTVPVKLAPFGDTPNSGSEYKVWLIRQGAGTTIAADGMHLNFSPANAKTDNFKVLFVPCTDCSPTSLLAGRKYYDANRNALFDDGEVLLEGVQMLIIAGDTTTIVTTDESGNWSTTIPTGSDYFVGEFLPFTGPEGEPGSYWEQTAPVPDIEGFQGYRGTANGDQAGLDFGNICFKQDAAGNPVASTTPCPVSDVPPPDPTPSPTPTPCPDCSTTSLLSGKKFYDGNVNGSFDVGELPVAGVKIAVILTTADGTTVTFATTDTSGDWSLTVPNGAQYIIGEYLPDTDPAIDPGAYWEQTAPAPNDEGFRGYSGTVSADQSGLNFGDICYQTDGDGNPVASATPCSVKYPNLSPTPTPTPTPSPAPDQ